MIVELSNYKKPEPIEVTSKGFVTYGDNNTGFTDLIRLYKNSPTNAAIINGLNRLVYGKGLTAKNANLHAVQFAKAVSMIAPDELRKAVIDSNIMANVAFLVTRSKNGVNAKIEHIPTQMVAPGVVDSEGYINSFFYSPNLGKVDSNVKDAKQYPNFDVNPDAPESIKYIKPYTPNSWYFNDPDYQGSIPYMDVEIENGKYHVNNVKTKFSAQTSITLFNGDPGDDKRKEVKRKVRTEYAGSEGNNLMIHFVDKDGLAPKIEALPVRDLHLQQEFIGTEATNKILLGHGVVAPMLFGIKDKTGLGNNADELETSFILFNNMTIIPKQTEIIEGLESIFLHYGITLNFYMETLSPNEFVDGDISAQTGDKEASYNGAQVSSALGVMENVKSGVLTKEQAIIFLIQMLQFDKDVAESMFDATNAIEQLSSVNIELDSFINLGENEIEGYELFSTAKVDSDELDDEIKTILINEFEDATTLQQIFKLVGVGKATPVRDSSQDNENFAVRYRYMGNKNPERGFCKAMMSASKLYRKEDIIRMETRPVNPGFGKNGTDTYSIWDYKGGGLLSKTFKGGTCKHFWQREIYLKKGSGDKRKINLEKKITVAESRRLGFRPETNNKKVGTTPHSNYTTRF